MSAAQYLKHLEVTANDSGPYYLVRAGKVDQVEKTLHRLARKGHYSDLMIKQQIALMEHTNEMEKTEAKSGSYAECFKGSNRRRTEIVGMAWTTQLFNGSHMSSYATLLCVQQLRRFTGH